MIHPLGVTLELRAVEIDIPQVSRAVTFRLIIKVGRRRIAAPSTGGHGLGSHRLAGLRDGHKAIAAGSVNLSLPPLPAPAARGQPAPRPGRKAHRNAGSGVGERMNDVTGKTLKAIDVAPRRLPSSKVGREFVRGR